MKLIIIPCCGTKKEGGWSVFQPSNTLQESIGPAAFNSLMAARHKLAMLIGLAPGPDLGFDMRVEGVRFLPAFQRYDGIIYRIGQLNKLYRSDGPWQIIIVSALYGILEVVDPIRNYNLAMSDSVAGIRMGTRWRQHGLGDFLCTYIQHQKPDKVFDFLSGTYRKAVLPWPEYFGSELPREIFSYPGQGIGSNYRRGEDLQKLLRS